MWTKIAGGTFVFITIFLEVSTERVIVHSSAQLICSHPCNGDVSVEYAKVDKCLVTACKLDVCSEGDAFKNRTKLTYSKDGWCLQLNRVQYNDDGLYIFFCDDTVLCHRPLHVIAPISVEATVGDTVTIPYYAHTSKIIAVNDIMYCCELDSKLLIKHQQGETSYGPGFRGHLFMSPEAYKHGNLSLTISNVQHFHRGTIRCTHRHEEPVHPEAVTLSITDVKACSTAEVGHIGLPWWAVLLENIALLALLSLGYFLFKKLWVKKMRETFQVSCSDDLDHF